MSRWIERSFLFSTGIMFSGLCAAVFGQIGLHYDLPTLVIPEGLQQDQFAHHMIDRGELLMKVGGMTAIVLPILVFAGVQHRADLEHHD